MNAETSTATEGANDGPMVKQRPNRAERRRRGHMARYGNARSAFKGIVTPATAYRMGQIDARTWTA